MAHGGHGLEDAGGEGARGRGSGLAHSCSWEVEGATATARDGARAVEERMAERRGCGGGSWGTVRPRANFRSRLTYPWRTVTPMRHGYV